ncbi:hypothetical protein NFI96_003684 [Prochilodus magdalenae]|nr:hypothetical protein NFI96_003684 [Prochilodus magdalenae]
MVMMMSSGMKMKMDEAQALARNCASRPDFLPCDGSVCATHSHGKCFRLHWCCCLGWCHLMYPAGIGRKPASIPVSVPDLTAAQSAPGFGQYVMSAVWW